MANREGASLKADAITSAKTVATASAKVDAQAPPQESEVENASTNRAEHRSIGKHCQAPPQESEAEKVPSKSTEHSSIGKHCQALRQARRAAHLGRELNHSLRRLRYALRACRSCPMLDDCPRLERLNQQVNAALAQIAEEWMEI